MKRNRFSERSLEVGKSLKYLKAGYDIYKDDEDDHFPSSQESFFEEIQFADSIVDQNKEQLKYIQSQISKN